MVDITLTEEEQVEQIKRWWSNYGLSVILGVALGLGLMYGWQYWQGRQQTQREQASVLYQQLLSDFSQDNTASVQQAATQLQNDYSRSPYAALAGFYQAKVALAAKNDDTAVAALQWVYENAREPALKYTAQLRLARVLAEQQQYQAALQLLDNRVSPAYQGMLDEIRGDVYRLSGDAAQAKQAYQAALLQADPSAKAGIDQKITNLSYLMAESSA